MTQKSSLLWLCLVAPVVIYSGAAFVFIFWGGFIGDEGYYALMMRNLLRGMKPYRDFLCVQMPLFYYVYAGWFYLVGVGIESGRILSGILGAGSVALITMASARRVGQWGALFGGLLVACNPQLVFDMTGIKTQSLAVFWSSCLLFVLSKGETARPWRRAALALLFGTLMFLTRLSLLPALVLLWLLLGWELRRQVLKYVGLVGANAVLIAVVFAYFYSDGNMIFGIYGVHMEYWGATPWTFFRLSLTIMNWIRNELPIIYIFFCAMGFFLFSLWQSLRTGKVPADSLFCTFLLFSYWGYTLLHWRSVQNYASHQTVVVPFAILFSVIIMTPVLGRLVRRKRLFYGLAFSLLFLPPVAFGQWSLFFNGNCSLGKIREALTLIERYAANNDTILSFNVELAVDGGYAIPVSCTMGEFSYVSNMPQDLCSKYKMINLQMLVNEIGSGRNRILCLGNRELEIMGMGNEALSARLKELIERRYVQVGSIGNYGQFDQDLHVFSAK